MKKLKKPILAVNTVEASKRIGCSESLLRKMRAEGTGPNYCRIGSDDSKKKKIVYPIKNLREYLEKNLVKTAG